MMVGMQSLRSRLGALAALGFLALAGTGTTARAADDADAMTFTVVAGEDRCPGCILVNASGEITENSSRAFAVFLASSRLKGTLPKEARKAEAKSGKAPRVVVAFESIGGKVVAALIIGRRIRELGWTTVVGRGVVRDDSVMVESVGCYSACTMVMLGGVERYVVPGSKAGVHQFSPQFGEGENFNSADMNQIVRDYGRQVVNVFDYVQEMGAPNEFFVSTLRTPYTSMDVMSSARWLSTGLATGTIPGNGETPIADILNAGSPSSATAVKPAAAEPVEKHAEAIAEAEPALGTWTVVRPTGGKASASFVDASVRVSVACGPAERTARLDLTFKDLDPIDLEHIRAAAFASRRVRIGEREVAIANVVAARRGEQGIAALLGVADLDRLSTAETLTFTVLDKSGRPAGRVGSVPIASGLGAIKDAVAACRA